MRPRLPRHHPRSDQQGRTFGVSLDQQRILLEVGARAGAEIAELRTALDIDAGQLSRAVRDLKAGGAIEVRQSSVDRRRRTVVVTEAGRRVCEQLNSANDMAIGELLDGFSDAERARLVSAMETVHWFASSIAGSGSDVLPG